MRPKTSLERQRHIISLYQGGMSGCAIAAHLKMSKNNVCKILRDSGVTPGTGRRNLFSPTVELQIIEKYTQGRTLESLAKEYKTTGGTLSKMFERRGVSRRPRGGVFKTFSKEQLADMSSRWLSGESQASLAERYGVCQTVMSKVLYRLGVSKSDKIVRGSRHGNWKGGRTKSGGYIRVLVSQNDPCFSMSDSDGRVAEHRLVMARHLGRPLYDYETVHHKNGKKDDNSLDNLQLCIGNHGTDICLCCAKCGSNDLRPVELAHA